MIAVLIRAREGVPVRVPANVYEQLALEGERVAAELALNFGGVTRLPNALRFDNMIGTIATPAATVEISPKTNPGQDWLQSVLDLLDGRPVSITENTPASDSAHQSTFVELIARIYTSRLGQALSAEGAITTIETEFTRSNMLNGRLRVEDWVKRAAYDGHRFPVDRQVLTTNNVYSAALSYVGQLLSHHIRDGSTRRLLSDSIVELSGGREVLVPPINAIGLELPDQWGSYQPAWVIAQMVLQQKSRFGERPHAHGMSLAIEPWILLERLLERTLTVLARQLGEDGRSYTSRQQHQTVFLTGSMRDDARRFLKPDCVLLCDGVPVVNFEAKYRDYEQTGAPLRTESYQAITAGRALGTPLSILVYPNSCATEQFIVNKLGHPPEELAIVGLDLFGYRRGQGELPRAERIRRLLKNTK